MFSRPMGPVEETSTHPCRDEYTFSPFVQSRAILGKLNITGGVGGPVCPRGDDTQTPMVEPPT